MMKIEWLKGRIGLILLAATWIGFSPGRCRSSGVSLDWPEITRECRPWTRWWWPGSAVDREDLTRSLEEYRQAGLGGVEITPIYGVAGYENRFIAYLSPRWMEVLEHTLSEASRLDLGVDMATGTGWPFGGPWVDAKDACKYIAFKSYTLRSGELLEEPVQLEQRSFVRSVGTQVYQLYGDILGAPEGTMNNSTANPARRPRARELSIDQLKEPISANADLQTLALEQVRFRKKMLLQSLMAFSVEGKSLDLTKRVEPDGRLDWTAPEGEWTLYALFLGWHGKMVERAAPGGEGNVIDHFSEAAIRNYLKKFDAAFAGHDLGGMRGFFNDSYEVDDARGNSNWTPGFFREFRRRRGYNLQQYLPALLGKDTEEKNARVLCDFRETISDLLLDTFTAEWRRWAHRRGGIIRDQAHGSPANILDLYAACDIPETEGTDLLRIKFASSAAHVTGKRLTSSESATWLNEHFKSTLADVKQNLDRFFLGGVNHIFYHGTCYSPKDDPWPGWLFYAAVHFNPRNPWWKEFGALNQYVARAQSFLQSGAPDNPVLLYFPIYDTFSTPSARNSLITHFDGGMGGITGEAFKIAANTMQERGFGFDFISDRQLRNATVLRDGTIKTARQSGHYRILVVPQCEFIPLATFQSLTDLARGGATILAFRGLPGDVPGMVDLEARRRQFHHRLEPLAFAETPTPGIQEARIGNGVFYLGANLDSLLAHAEVPRESMIDQGLSYIRRVGPHGWDYFIANRSERMFDGWVPIQVPSPAVAIFDPMTGRRGYGMSRTPDGNRTEIYLQLASGRSLILRAFQRTREGAAFPFYKPAGMPREIEGAWKIHFLAGGPGRPVDITTPHLDSWTDWDDPAAKKFSGTAAYSIAFDRPSARAEAWRLDLGEVRHSARIRLNGRELGTLIMPPWQFVLTKDQLDENNTLEINVTNLMDNRIADLDRRGVVWKKFYNVNFPAHARQNRGENGLFSAAAWEPSPSGLLGPVTLTPMESFPF